MLKQSYFKLNYTQKLFIVFKMAYSRCFGLRGNLDFRDFPPKNIIISTTGQWPFIKHISLCLKLARILTMDKVKIELKRNLFISSKKPPINGWQIEVEIR